MQTLFNLSFGFTNSSIYAFFYEDVKYTVVCDIDAKLRDCDSGDPSLIPSFELEIIYTF